MRNADSRTGQPLLANSQSVTVNPQSPIHNRQSLSLFSATMLVVGNTIGVGIFTTSGVVAEHLPSPGWMLTAWILGGFLSLAGALVWAELGAAFPHAGGEYVYLREAFGPFWGFLCGWAAFLASFSGSIAVLAIALAEYLQALLPPAFGGSMLWKITIGHLTYALSLNQVLGILLVWLISGLNYRGLHLGSFMQNVLSVSKLLAIGGLLVAGMSMGSGTWTHLTAAVPESSLSRTGGALGLALIPIVFTYSGWNAVTYIASEVRNPETTLPRALAFGTFITIGVYLALNLLYLYAVPVTQLRGVVRVGELVAGALFGPGAAWVMAILIAVSIAGVLNVMVLTGGRIYFAMARDGVFFARAAELHPRFQVPGNALLLQAAWTSVLILSGTFAQLLTYSTVVIIGFSIVTVGALFLLRWQQPFLSRPYHTWGYPWVPVLYVLTSVGILFNALREQPIECFFGLLLCVAGVPAYRWWRGHNTRLGT
jgi:APA family basic amino acid/polyamine antiporter